ncbi:DMT family transporter [Pseudochelatococcus sp. B33]
MSLRDGGLPVRDVVFALIFPIAMAAGFVASKTVLDVLPPVLLSALRHTIAAAILVWFVPPPRGAMLRLFWITFIGATVQFSLTYAGIARLDVTTAVLLVQCEVPFAMIIAAVITRRMPTRAQIAGTILGLLGALIVFGTPSVRGEYGAALMVVLGALAWAISQNMIPTLRHVGAFQLATWLAVFATFQLWPLSYLLEGNPLPYLARLEVEDTMALLTVGIGPTIIGYGLWCLLIGRHGIVRLAPFLLTIPVIAIGFGVFLLGEELAPMTIVGGLITLAGVGLTLLRAPDKRLAEATGGEKA